VSNPHALWRKKNLNLQHPELVGKNEARPWGSKQNRGGPFYHKMVSPTNQMNKRRTFTRFFLFMVLSVMLFWARSSYAVQEDQQGHDILLDIYHRIEAKLERTSFGVPLYLESSDQDGRVHVDVYGIFHHPFSSILNVLSVPANWCDILSLHPNVKACTYRDMSGMWELTSYFGRKVYQSPEDTYHFTFISRLVEQQQNYMDIILDADQGPLGTNNHEMRFEAISLDGGSTFVRVSYAYKYGLALRLAEKMYFATLGLGKVGFTVSGTDSNGNPIYIGGPRGALERNAVRYYFAIQSFLDTMHHDEGSRFNIRTNRWYDLTSRYQKQLFEMEKKDYLRFKTQEHNNQIMLQRLIGTGLQ